MEVVLDQRKRSSQDDICSARARPKILLGYQGEQMTNVAHAILVCNSSSLRDMLGAGPDCSSCLRPDQGRHPMIRVWG